MNRRNFLQTGTCGLMGMGLPAGAMFLTGKPSSEVYQWLNRFAALSGAHRQFALLGLPESLQVQTQQTNAFMAARGYVSRDSGLFRHSGRKNICFYPLEMRHAGAGMTDLLVPVLTQQPDGNWQRQVVLTGYQVEALSRAAAFLSARNEPVAELLLPAGPAGEGGAYPTGRGSVRIDTRLQSGTASTHIVVLSDRETVYTETFTSEHCLRSATAVQA